MSGDSARAATRRQRPTPRWQPTTRRARRRSTTVGAIAGALSALAFTALHSMLIVDIWDRAAAMVIAGALCGSFLSRSYTTARPTLSAASWLAHNGLHVALLFALGVASLVLLEPVASMATLTVSAEPLGNLLPSALPLMAGASVIGTAVEWATSDRTLRSLPSALTTQVLLVLLVGHNFAILGLVELPDAGAALRSFLGVTLFLAASYALAYLLLATIVARIAARRSIAEPDLRTAPRHQDGTHTTACRRDLLCHRSRMVRTRTVAPRYSGDSRWRRLSAVSVRWRS